MSRDVLKDAAAALDALRAERARLAARLAEIDGVLGAVPARHSSSTGPGNLPRRRGRNVSAEVRTFVATHPGVYRHEIVAAVPGTKGETIAALVRAGWLRYEGRKRHWRYFPAETSLAGGEVVQ